MSNANDSSTNGTTFFFFKKKVVYSTKEINKRQKVHDKFFPCKNKNEYNNKMGGKIRIFSLGRTTIFLYKKGVYH